MKEVTLDSELTKMELEIASLQRKRCLHILEEYLLPELQTKSPHKIIESLIEIRDIFFFENRSLLFDFDKSLSVEKKNHSFTVVVDRFDSLILLSSHLKIRVNGKEAQFSLDDDTKAVSYNEIRNFGKALKKMLDNVKQLELVGISD